MTVSGLDTGTLVTVGLFALTMASASGAVLWRVRACEKAIDRLTNKLDEVVKTIVEQATDIAVLQSRK